MVRFARRCGAVVALALLAGVLAGCSGGAPRGDEPRVPTIAVSAPSVEPVAATEVTTVVDGLDVPWGLTPLDDGRLLVSLRDAARLVVVDPAAGTTTDVTGPGADRLAAETVPDGEGGLLGVAVAPSQPREVFVYRTGAADNAVLRGRLEPGPDGARLGELTAVVEGIPRAGHHDGGGLAFGPDGHLYVGTGDAGDPARAQDPDSLGGKILRVTTDGGPAPGNPDEGSPVWSSGHRNVQGLGWTADGTMVASEFGQDTYDELNVIEPGANYGWPDAEGPGSPADSGFTDPVAWWSPDEASPSGLAVTDEAVYLAGLRGERLWRVPFVGEAAGPAFGAPQALLVGELGRLRNVVAVDGRAGGPDGESVWVLTNNTDGRGEPREGDDRLVRVDLG